MNYVNGDCSSGPVPAVRVLTSPVNGNARVERMSVPIVRPATDILARCNGKPVDAMGVFYKSRAGFTGADTLTLDVDFRHGRVIRFVFNLNVR